MRAAAASSCIPLREAGVGLVGILDEIVTLVTRPRPLSFNLTWHWLFCPPALDPSLDPSRRWEFRRGQQEAAERKNQKSA